MVKLALTFITCLGALSGLVAAKSCKNGLQYCGYNLLGKGNYYNEIVAELQKNGRGVDPEHVSQSVYSCWSGGWITFKSYCNNGCHDGGSGHSDSCQ